MKRLIILMKTAIVVSLFSSCESILTNVDIPQGKPMYVMTSYLSPEDSIIKVKISLSTPIFNSQDTNKNDSIYLNGTMKINGVDILRVSGSNTFVIKQSEFPILPGQTYTITYDAPDGTKLKGSCEVPNNINTSLTFKVDSTLYTDENENNSTSYYVEYEFTDLPELGNNYQLFMFEKADNNGFKDSNILGFFDDKNNNGNTKHGKEELYMYSNNYYTINRYLILFTCDRNYYSYNNAVYIQDEIGNFPFSEPVIIPTNVENGLGCIGAFRKFVKNVN